MRYRINLIHKNRQYQEKQKVWHYVRSVTYVLFTLACLSHAVIFVVSQQAVQSYRKDLGEKESILQYLLSVKDKEAQLISVSEKTTALKTALDTDVNFAPYYSVFQSLFLNDYGDRAFEYIDTLSLDSSQNVRIVMTLPDEEGLSRLLSRLEGPQSLNFFESLKIGQLAIDTDTASGFKIEISGVLKKIPRKNLL